jgi:hypothetical protein
MAWVVVNIAIEPNPSAVPIFYLLKNPEPPSWLPEPPEPPFVFFPSNLRSIWRYACELIPRVALLELKKLAFKTTGLVAGAKMLSIKF